MALGSCKKICFNENYVLVFYFSNLTKISNWRMPNSGSISRYQKKYKAIVKISNNKKYEYVVQQTLWLSMLEYNKEWFIDAPVV